MLLGFDTSDDAAVYRLNDDTAAVLTLDFFTPVVDDPYEFGAIAAANALSDVFAMGAKPLTALNILAFPCSLGTDVVADVLRGGADKVREAGAFVVGGHSIEDDEPKYGLSVFGTVHPDCIVRNGGAQPGDALFYTKVLGSGIMNSAFRAGFEDDEGMRPVIASMMELNKAGSEAMAAAHVHAATDVTGFGLAGHLHEMLDASDASAELVWDDLPLFEGVYRYSCDFCRPAKTFGIIDWARLREAGRPRRRGVREPHGRAVRPADVRRPAGGRGARRGRRVRARVRSGRRSRARADRPCSRRRGGRDQHEVGPHRPEGGDAAGGRCTGKAMSLTYAHLRH